MSCACEGRGAVGCPCFRGNLKARQACRNIIGRLQRSAQSADVTWARDRHHGAVGRGRSRLLEHPIAGASASRAQRRPRLPSHRLRRAARVVFVLHNPCGSLEGPPFYTVAQQPEKQSDL
jgi:hypothetical protein